MKRLISGRTESPSQPGTEDCSANFVPSALPIRHIVSSSGLEFDVQLALLDVQLALLAEGKPVSLLSCWFSC